MKRCKRLIGLPTRRYIETIRSIVPEVLSQNAKANDETDKEPCVYSIRLGINCRSLEKLQLDYETNVVHEDAIIWLFHNIAENSHLLR